MVRKKHNKNAFLRFMSKMVILSLVLLTLDTTNHRLPDVAEAAGNVYHTIEITKSSFTEDVIAEKLGENTLRNLEEEDNSVKTEVGEELGNGEIIDSSKASISAKAYTSTTIDSDGNVLYTSSVAKSIYYSKNGLPDNGVIQGKEAHYQLQPYTEKNVAIMTGGIPIVTFTLNTNAKYEKLYFLTMSTKGTTYFDITLKFTDNTSSTYASYEYGNIIRDYISNFDTAISNLGMINRLNVVRDTASSGYPRMDETVITLRAADQKKTIRSITFNSYMQDWQTIKAGIFAVTGKVIGTLPEPTIPPAEPTIEPTKPPAEPTKPPAEPTKPPVKPTTPVLLPVTYLTANTATLNWNEISNADEYQVDISTNNKFNSMLPGYNGKSVYTNSLDVTGLSQNTKYYYRVRAKNSAGTSADATSNFTTPRYTLSIAKQPTSITVEENNIKESLSVQIKTSSSYSFIYTWYLCSDPAGKKVISSVKFDEWIGTSTYKIPTNLTAGEYYVYCAVTNSQVSTKTNIVKITVKSNYTIEVIKQPQSIVVEENNINETLDTAINSNSTKPFTYTWYLCRDAYATQIISTEVTGSVYKIPSELLQGEYYVYCLISNADISAKTNIAKITVQVNYKIEIIKHPESIIVEENNINETMSVQIKTNSTKPVSYTWYLCKDPDTTQIISKDTNGSTFKIPSGLLQGEYYVYCEISNADIKTIKTNTAKITVHVLYSIDISWGNMEYEFGTKRKWDPSEHIYVGEDENAWNLDCIDGENNKIMINNHSSRSLRTLIEYIQFEKAFNQLYDADTNVQGRFYRSNEEAVKASGFLNNLRSELNFGSNHLDEMILTDKWTGDSSLSYVVFFAFSGTPDSKNNTYDERQAEYETVGKIQIVFNPN